MALSADDPLLPVLKAAADENKVWHTNAMAKLNVLMPGGQYKIVSVAAGDPPLIFKGVRHGKKADYIFEFEPADSRPYEQIEMDERKVFQLVPGFEAHITTAMGFPPIVDQRMDADGNITAELPKPLDFTTARARFKRDALKAERLRKEEEAEKTANSEAERYANNSLWGAFA